MTKLRLLMLSLPLILTCSCGPKTLTPDELHSGSLSYLEEGKTTRETVVLRLGAPTTDFEKGRILTYRIAQDGKGGIVVRPRTSGLGVPQMAEYSLVLVFDEKGVLKKQSLVPMK